MPEAHRTSLSRYRFGLFPHDIRAQLDALIADECGRSAENAADILVFLAAPIASQKAVFSQRFEKFRGALVANECIRTCDEPADLIRRLPAERTSDLVSQGGLSDHCSLHMREIIDRTAGGSMPFLTIL